MIFQRHLQYFYGSQSKKKITETVLVWSFSDTFFRSNQMLKGSSSLLRAILPLNLVLERMKCHVILFYSLICEWDYLIN